MGESLTQQRFVRELNEGRPIDCKTFSAGGDHDKTGGKKHWLNFVPAAAAIQKVRALFGVTGRKGYVGGHKN
jgi:hypothetical protein